ncbi:MAG: YicC/YloC family endoribonuclease [Paracoccaceae bacterium]
MTNSMTGFAALEGAAEGWNWAWDIRSVNARGLDLRLRVPDWIEGLEQALRPMLQKSVARGNVSLTLKVRAEGGDLVEEIDTDALERALNMIAEIESTAQNKGVSLTPATTADVLSIRGVLTTASVKTDTAPLKAMLIAQLPELLTGFLAMRATEGAALEIILADQFDQIETLTIAANKAAAARKDKMAATLRENLARVLENADGADADRVAQELAILTVKSDITEEIDRLAAHVKAARELLATTGPVGRKLDFLAQEFNREANTLCSKAQSSELTRIGLDLKAVIDQMREQVQNVE